MMKPTPRGAGVVRRAQLLGLSAEYVGPGVKIDGKTRTVTEADAYVQGYFDGSARVRRGGGGIRPVPRLSRRDGTDVHGLRETRGGQPMTKCEHCREPLKPCAHCGEPICPDCETCECDPNWRTTDETRVETRPGLRRPRSWPGSAGVESAWRDHRLRFQSATPRRPRSTLLRHGLPAASAPLAKTGSEVWNPLKRLDGHANDRPRSSSRMPWVFGPVARPRHLLRGQPRQGLPCRAAWRQYNRGRGFRVFVPALHEPWPGESM